MPDTDTIRTLPASRDTDAEELQVHAALAPQPFLVRAQGRRLPVARHRQEPTVLSQVPQVRLSQLLLLPTHH